MVYVAPKTHLQQPDHYEQIPGPANLTKMELYDVKDYHEDLRNDSATYLPLLTNYQSSVMVYWHLGIRDLRLHRYLVLGRWQHLSLRDVTYRTVSRSTLSSKATHKSATESTSISCVSIDARSVGTELVRTEISTRSVDHHFNHFMHSSASAQTSPTIASHVGRQLS